MYMSVLPECPYGHASVQCPGSQKVHAMQMLGIEPMPYARAVNALNQ